MNRRLNARVFLSILIVFAAISLVLCIGIGPVSVEPGTVSRIILSKLPVVGENIPVTWTETEDNVVWEVRMPRVLLGFCVGCALAFSGTAMQTLVKNELADPFILGVSYGASAFSGLGMITGAFVSLGVFQNAANAMIGSLFSLAFVVLYSLNGKRVNIDQLLLGGVAISMFMKSFLKILGATSTAVQKMVSSGFWTSGGLASARMDYLGWPMVLILVCMIFLMINHRSLNIFLFGNETAHTLGVRVRFMENTLILATSLIVGVTVAVSGGIGFIGLVAPHVTRILVGGDHKSVFPISALMGGIFLLWCDVMARLMFAPREMSVGIFTALIGGPLFIILLKKKQK